MQLSPKLLKTVQLSVEKALEEDIGDGDITAQLIPANHDASATVITRENCVVCGQAWFDETFKQLGLQSPPKWQVKEGEFVEAGATLVSLQGNARILLTGERCALNFLQTLSGVATVSREYAQKAEGSSVTILDTRKTIPGLRIEQKYAVSVGGCENHRIGLYDAFLIKENHIAACGGIRYAIERAREIAPDKIVEVEVENESELEEAIQANADIVMLDNFPPEKIKTAIQRYGTQVQYEASGNIDIDRLNDFIIDGQLRVSVGALTKHLRAIDLSFRIE